MNFLHEIHQAEEDDDPNALTDLNGQFLSVRTQLVNVNLIKLRINKSLDRLNGEMNNPDKSVDQKQRCEETEKLRRCLDNAEKYEAELKEFLYVDDALNDCIIRKFDPRFYITKDGHDLQSVLEETAYLINKADPLQQLDELYD